MMETVICPCENGGPNSVKGVKTKKNGWNQKMETAVVKMAARIAFELLLKPERNC